MKQQPIFRILALLAILNLTPIMAAQAAQVVLAKDNGEIAANVSAKEISRITIEGDRIASLAAMPRGFGVEHDAESGDLYLIPQRGLQSGQLVNMFLTSEEGRSYQLLLQVRDIPSEQIIIRLPSAPLAKESAVVGGTPRRQELARLMRGVINGEFLNDYARSDATLALTSIATHPGVVPVEIWQGAAFTAWRVRFTGATKPALDTFSPQAAAVWISDDGRNGVVILETGEAHNG